MNKPRAFAFALTLATIAAIGGYAALRSAQAPQRVAAGSRPVWTEVAWPFPVDQWGKATRFA